MSVSSITIPCFQPSLRLPSQKAPARPRSKVGSVSQPKIYAMDDSSSVPAMNRMFFPPKKLPLKEIPGGYGLPFLGPVKDRLDYFYNLGRDEFFKSRIKQHNSTVIRLNMPPGPFISSDSRVIALLDGKSFHALFDVSKVEKKDLFTGTYMPSTKLTGGYRILSYLDPSEPKHEKIKKLLFHLLKSSHDKVLPEFHHTFSELFDSLEKSFKATGFAFYNCAGEDAAFNFLGRCFYGVDPRDTKLGKAAPLIIAIWVLFQLGPIVSLGLTRFIEEPLLRTFPLPPVLTKCGYNRLYDYINQSAGAMFEEAEKLGIPKEEACHNLLFATCFNTFGGMKIFFPSVFKWLGTAGENVHKQLAKEIRSAVKADGGKVTMAAMEKMPLMKSVVYEAFRIDPPVPFQYARAKTDLTIESHDASFKVKKGEMLFGYQPFATKDPKIFEKPEEFVADRFVGGGEKLLQHVLWSNGPETESPTTENKQCAGKSFVILMTRLLLVEFFLRFDSFKVKSITTDIGAFVLFTSLKKASF